MTLKEKWDEYQTRIDELDELRDMLYEQKRKCEQNIDHSYANNKYVKAYLNGEGIETIKTIEEFNQFLDEGANYITDCVVDIFYKENDYESDNEDEQSEERSWTFETLWYNVIQMFCATSYGAIDDLIEDVENQQHHDCISDYQDAYENAKDDLYYGYGYETWYESNRESFESEEDAKLVWYVAFYAMADAD